VALGPEDGITQDSAISLDNVRTVPRSLLTERITTLRGARMHEVCRALALATACE
jgi:mRNA-degrading endonuclease toxin of MazEF toxin-antitoxin module